MLKAIHLHVCLRVYAHLSVSTCVIQKGASDPGAQVPGCFESPNKKTAKVVCPLNPWPSLQPLHRVFRGVPFNGPGAHHLSRTVSELQGSSFLCLLRSAVTDVRCWGYRCAPPGLWMSTAVSSFSAGGKKSGPRACVANLLLTKPRLQPQ